MNTFYFNTGCTFAKGAVLAKGEVWRNGVKQIMFDTEAPEEADLLFLCDFPDLPESKQPDVIVREVFNTTLLSKYAYMRVSEKAIGQKRCEKGEEKSKPYISMEARLEAIEQKLERVDRNDEVNGLKRRADQLEARCEALEYRTKDKKMEWLL